MRTPGEIRVKSYCLRFASVVEVGHRPRPRHPRAVFFGDFPRLETAYFIPFGDSADGTINADISTTGILVQRTAT